MNDRQNRRTTPETAPPQDRQQLHGPFKVVRDRHGRLWICGLDVDEAGDLAGQGCWRCGDLTFTSRT